MIVTPIQIRFSDTDLLGHINNSKYSQYFDAGRLDCLSRLIGGSESWDKKTLVLVHIDTDYLQPTFLHDIIVVETSIAEVGNRSIKMLQRIVDDKGIIRVESRSVMSAFDRQTQQSFVIPEEWRERAKQKEFL